MNSKFFLERGSVYDFVGSGIWRLYRLSEEKYTDIDRRNKNIMILDFEETRVDQFRVYVLFEGAKYYTYVWRHEESLLKKII